MDNSVKITNTLDFRFKANIDQHRKNKIIIRYIECLDGPVINGELPFIAYLSKDINKNLILQDYIKGCYTYLISNVQFDCKNTYLKMSI